MAYKPLPKPVTERTLKRRYAQLAETTHGRIDITTDFGKNLSSLLHRYFSSFSNLYGITPLQTAWELLGELEPELISKKKLLKKDLVAFTDILRSEDLPYYVLDIDEIYHHETVSYKPIDRLVVNKELILYGYYRFANFHIVMDGQGDTPYVLLSKQEYFAWSEPDAFRKTPYARDMIRFLEKLYVSKNSTHCDVNGRPIKGKSLRSFIFWDRNEQFMYDQAKRKWEKDTLLAEYNLIESEKIMRKIELNIRVGDPFISPALFIQTITERLEQVGVKLSPKQLDTFLQLYTDLNNNSRLWCNCGWTPAKLAQCAPADQMPSISFGPGLQQAFANGDIDQDELERMIKEHGFHIES